MPTKQGPRKSRRNVIKRTFFGDGDTPEQHGSHPRTEDILVPQVVELQEVQENATATSSSSNDNSEEEEHNESVVSTKKHPSTNYSRVQLYDRWKSSEQKCTELRDQKKILMTELKDLRRENNSLGKVDQWRIELEGKVSDLTEKLNSQKTKYDYDKERMQWNHREDKDHLLNQKLSYENLLSTKNNEISKVKYDYKALLNEEKVKNTKLDLEKKNLVDKLNEVKNEMVGLKQTAKQLNDVKIQKLKYDLALKAQQDKAEIR